MDAFCWDSFDNQIFTCTYDINPSALNPSNFAHHDDIRHDAQTTLEYLHFTDLCGLAGYTLGTEPLDRAQSDSQMWTAAQSVSAVKRLPKKSTEKQTQSVCCQTERESQPKI